MAYVPGVFTVTGNVNVGSTTKPMVLTIGSALTPATEEIASKIVGCLIEQGVLNPSQVTILPGSDTTPPPPM
jgi:hypothetical protein